MMHRRPAVLLFVLAVGCASTDEPASPSQAAVPAAPKKAKPEPEPKAEAPAKCIQTFEIDNDHSVLEEQRRRGGAQRWDDFPKKYAAAYVEPETQHPVERVESIQIGKTPLLWFTADFSEAVVNAAVLTELTAVDAPGLKVGTRVTVGGLTELGQGKIEGRTLLEFLLKAEAIRTYWHIGSKVCLLSDDAKGGTYRAELSGEHVYFTNEENRDEFGFSFELDGEGQIWVTGSKPMPFAR